MISGGGDTCEAQAPMDNQLSGGGGSVRVKNAYSIVPVENGFTVQVSFYHSVMGNETKIYVYSSLVDMFEFLSAELNSDLYEMRKE